MRGYYIDGIDISTFGAVAILGQEAYPLSGIFDLPKRKGETERTWGTEIEPFVDKEDINLDGRNLTLLVAIKDNTPEEFQSRLSSFKTACINCKVLGTDFGDFNVIQKEDITVSQFPDENFATISVKFWQEEVTLPALTITPTGRQGYLLDNYNLKDFGIIPSELKNESNSGKRIEVNTTKPYTQTIYRDKQTVSLSCSMLGRNLTDLYTKMMQFQAFCTGPSLRTFKTPEGQSFNLYIKDGITVKTEHETILSFDLKMRLI